MKIDCIRPDEVIRLGNIRPAGCAVTIQRDVRAVARAFTADPSVEQQYANTPVVVVSQAPGSSRVLYTPNAASSVSLKRPGFLARFFGAK